MVAAARRDGVAASGDAAGATTYVVDVPGGRLAVTERLDGHVELSGPAVLVGEGTVDPARLAAA
jgi:diaminopimelate epimerase